MNNSLQEFYNNKDMRVNVHGYLIAFLREEAIKKVFDKEDTSAVAEAKEVIDKAFEEMDYMFQSKPKKKPELNEAR